MNKKLELVLFHEWAKMAITICYEQITSIIWSFIAAEQRKKFKIWRKINLWRSYGFCQILDL